MDETGFIQERPDIQGLASSNIMTDVTADMENTDNIVDGPFIDRQAAVILLLDKSQNLLLGHIDIDRSHIDTAGQDTFHRNITELQGGRDQFSLFLIDLSLLCHIFDNVINVIFCDGGLVIPLCHFCCRISNPGQQRSRRPENCHQHAKSPCRRKTQGFTVFTRNTLRQHLSEEKHYQRGDQSGNGDCRYAPSLGHIDRHDRSCGKMYNICTDQERCDRPVEMLCYI